MKIAVATNDGNRVTGHIGKCRSFMVFEIEESVIKNQELRENTFTHHATAGHSHGEHSHGEHSHGEHSHGEHSHNRLIEGLKDCSFLISKGGGWRVVEDLKKNNIVTLFSDEEMITDAVNKFINGELKNDTSLVCEGNEHTNN